MDLSNLRALHDKASAFFDGVFERHHEQMACQAGCSSCCQSLTLFETELERLRPAVQALPAPARDRLAARLAAPETGTCVLLDDGRCTVYDARPTICRTHGAPIVFRDAAKNQDGSDAQPDRAGQDDNGQDDREQRRRDVCPLNFTGPLTLEALPDSDLLDLDRLNAMLVLVNRFTVGPERAERRRPIREAARTWLADTSDA